MFVFQKTNETTEITVRNRDNLCTWGALVEDFQRFLTASGYIFDMNFDMRTILEEEHDLRFQEQQPTDECCKKAASPCGQKTGGTKAFGLA